MVRGAGHFEEVEIWGKREIRKNPIAVGLTGNGEGDCIQFSNKLFRRELAAWIRPNSSRGRDGIPAHALGMGT
jgi:hypothetical protein